MDLLLSRLIGRPGRTPDDLVAAMQMALGRRLARPPETIQAICHEARDLLLADGDPLAKIRSEFVIVRKYGAINEHIIGLRTLLCIRDRPAGERGT